MYACGWVAASVSLALWVYVVIALLNGSVHLAGRSSEITVYVSQSPIAYAIGVILYVLGAVLFSWIGLGLVSRRKSSSSNPD